jgi:hypothetical protein
MNRRLRWTALLLAMLVVVGCSTATAPATRETRSDSSPRVRCLSDPSRDNAAGIRPLFFFFCVEGP